MILRIVREPLCHFLLLGACLFVLYGQVAPDMQASQAIVVSTGQQQALKARFENTWQRAPGMEEMQALIDDYVLDEIYYREAKSLGIDKNDMGVRQRLRQKMAFLLTEASAQAAPTDAQLAEFYAENNELFARPAVYSFQQSLLPAEVTDGEIQAIRQQLSEGKGYVPGASMLAAKYWDKDEKQLSQLFGRAFTDKLVNLSPGQWSGPVTSAYGQHLIKLTHITPASIPELADIKPQVTERWLEASKQKNTQSINQQLLAKYNVVVEKTDG